LLGTLRADPYGALEVEGAIALRAQRGETRCIYSFDCDAGALAPEAKHSVPEHSETIEVSRYGVVVEYHCTTDLSHLPICGTGCGQCMRALSPNCSSEPRLNLSLNGNQAAQDTDCYGFCPASGAELGQNGANVELHGMFRDDELRSHLLISLPKSN
jgi:hypothetical protein